MVVMRVKLQLQEPEFSGPFPGTPIVTLLVSISIFFAWGIRSGKRVIILQCVRLTPNALTGDGDEVGQ